jgi:hypothetical protein
MLVLNTHLDTLVALLRYANSTGDRQYRELTGSARLAALRILSLRPAEFLYRAVFRLINLTMLPTSRAAALPTPIRALKRIAWKYVIPWLPELKTRFPRLVMPGGYVDRALSLKNWGHRYLSINSMDLARIARQLPGDPEFSTLAADAVRYAFESGIMDKWRENPDDRYALAFLAETLCHLCTLDTRPEWREKLAKTFFILDDLGIGFPPSALGGNREFGQAARASAMPDCADAQLRFALLPSAGADELIVLNNADCAVSLDVSDRGFGDYAWRDRDENELRQDVLIPPRGWIRGLAR